MDGSSYVPVTAMKAYSTDGNGSNQGSSTVSGYYIHWNDNGFTGKGWEYLSVHINYTGFIEIAESAGVECTLENFKLYIAGTLPNTSFPGNLNNVLGDESWDNSSKTNFVASFVDDLGIWGNVPEDSFYYSHYDPNGCIEAL